MIEGKALSKHIACSPRKGRYVTNLIKGKNAIEAKNILKFVNRKAARYIEKVLKSAIANAIYKSDYELSDEDLNISKILVSDGVTYKRIRPRAQGRAYRIRKRHCHIFVSVIEKETNESNNINKEATK